MKKRIFPLHRVLCPMVCIPYGKLPYGIYFLGSEYSTKTLFDVGIYKRKQERKKERKHDFDHDNGQKRKHALDLEGNQEKRKKTLS